MGLTGPPRSYQTKLDCPRGQRDTLSRRAAWTQDSSHWLELTKESQDRTALLLHKLDGGVERRFPLFDKSGPLLLIGVTKRNTALIEANVSHAGERPRWQFFDLDLQSGLLTANAVLNRSGELQWSNSDTIVLSQKGDRLAWVNRTSQSTVERLNRLLRRKPQITRYALFSENIDGTQLVLADSIDTIYPSEIAQTHWTPDGKQISFVVFGAIYTVPVAFK